MVGATTTSIVMARVQVVPPRQKDLPITASIEHECSDARRGVNVRAEGELPLLVDYTG